MKIEEFYNKRNIVNNKKEELLSGRGNEILSILLQYNTNRLLDVGCGDIYMSRFILKRCNIKEYCGIDISDSGVTEAKKVGIKAIKLDINNELLPYEDNYFDFVLAGELIEHLFDTDHFLAEVYRVLKRNGYLLITTPNLASWHNRISLLLGYQPHFSEVSTKHNIGKMFPTNKVDCSGHLRLFTLRALREFVRKYSFKLIKTSGYGTTLFIDKYIFNHFPSMSTGLILLCQK